MRKYGWLFAALILLTGCTAQQTFETVSDAYVQPAVSVQQLQMTLPQEAGLPAMESENGGSLYLCDEYTVTVQTLSSGDLTDTFRQLTGYTPQQLTVMERDSGGITRYEAVWSAAGEGADQVGRIVVLDDGSYHYAITVMAEAAAAGELTDTWNELMDGISLVSTG